MKISTKQELGLESAEDLIEKVLDALVERYGSETFVADGYAYYDDATRLFSSLLNNTEEFSKHLESFCKETEEEKKLEREYRNVKR